MSEKPLDCRGLACPNPVIKTKELIDRGGVGQLTVLVDNPAAQENVSRFSSAPVLRCGEETQGDAIAVTGSRGGRTVNLSGMVAEKPGRPATGFSFSWARPLGRGEKTWGPGSWQFHRHPQGNGAGVVVPWSFS